MSAALSLPLPSSRVETEREGTAAFILSLRARGIFDREVLRAVETVPRELFAPRRYADLSRSDVALPIACGQTMTAPATVAQMLAALDLRPGHRVLEVGTGTGYVTALLGRVGAEIYSIERQPSLVESARARLAAVGLKGRFHVECSDGLEGGRIEARFDRILLNGVAPRIGPALTSRLVAGGRLVGGTSAAGQPRLLTIARQDDGELDVAIGAPLRIGPLVPGEILRGRAGRETEV